VSGNTKQVIQDYDTVFYNSIPFRKNDLLRITYFRIPGLPGLHFVPWNLGSGCLGAAAPVTGAAADEYNLNVVDCNVSVTVARRSSISVSGGLGGTPSLGLRT
jgi:hypothetical protein